MTNETFEKHYPAYKKRRQEYINVLRQQIASNPEAYADGVKLQVVARELLVECRCRRGKTIGLLCRFCRQERDQRAAQDKEARL